MLQSMGRKELDTTMSLNNNEGGAPVMGFVLL